MRAMREMCRGFAFPLALGLAALAGGCSSDTNTTSSGRDTSTAMAMPSDGASGKDWPTYHGTFKSYHFSSLDQINSGNVQDLQVDWMHFPGRSVRGVQSMTLAQDGLLYYSGSYSRVFALDGATGKVIWAFYPELDEDLIKKQTHTPYNRGVALGQGKVYVGTMDGRLMAIDQKTGKLAWETKLINSKKLTVGFTGAPLFVNETVTLDAQGGEWPYRGPIFGVDANTGHKKWAFLTVAGTPQGLETCANN